MAISTGIEVGKKPRIPRCIAATAVASSSRFDKSVTMALGHQCVSRARSSSTEGSIMVLSPIASATRRTSRPDTLSISSVVVISRTSKPRNSRVRMFRMQVRVRTRGSMMTRTGNCADPFVRSTKLVTSSMMVPNSTGRYQRVIGLVIHGSIVGARFLSAYIETDAYVAIRRCRRRSWIAVGDIGLIFFHEVQKRTLANVLARRLFAFDVPANGIDRLPERIFPHGALHVLERRGCRIFHLRSNRCFCFCHDMIGRVSRL